MIDDDEWGAVGGMRIGNGNRRAERKPVPVSLSSTSLTRHGLGSNSGRRGGKAVTNRLSCNMALRVGVGSSERLSFEMLSKEHRRQRNTRHISIKYEREKRLDEL
jgi:hypothetical protein